MPVDRTDPNPTFHRQGPLHPPGRPRLWMLALATLAVSLSWGQSVPAWADSTITGRDWIDARLEKVLPRQRVGIPHCQSMVDHQRLLAKLRDTIAQVVAQGKAARGSCQARDDSTSVQACIDSLQPLRNRVKALRATETARQDSVRFHASRCDQPTFEAWEQLQSLREKPDTGDAFLGDSTSSQSAYDQLVEFEFASVWHQNQAARRSAAPSTSDEHSSPGAAAFRERIRSYLRRKGAQTPSAMTHFLLAALDHRQGRDDLALARLRRIPARDSTTSWKGPVAMLYGQILASSSPDSATPLLRTAQRDSALANPARYLLAKIELRRGDPQKALAHLSTYLSGPPAPEPGTRSQAVRLAALALVRMADAPYKVREILKAFLPTVAQDTIAFQVARDLLGQNAAKESIEILSNFQLAYPGTLLGEEVRVYLSQVRRNRPGIVIR